MKNLTERIKKKSLSNSIKKRKEKSIKSIKMKNIISPRKKMNKRTKTELFDENNYISFFGQQNEVNAFIIHNSINRQILKNIKLKNPNKPKKDISLINKKIINYHYNLTTNNNINNTSINNGISSYNNEKNKTRINSKYKHILANSRNLTSIGIINKENILHIKDINKKRGVIFSLNKTESISRNHSKDKSNTTIKKNFLESFSPKNSKEIIYNKIKKIHNKNKTAIISSFLKSLNNSNKTIKNLEIKRKKNQNINFNYQSFNKSCRNKNF